MNIQYKKFIWHSILTSYPKEVLWAFMGFMFFTVACYPGFMSPDSLVQYKQALTLKFSDGHPPIMAWLWSKLLYVLHGPQSLLLLQLSVFWIGLYVWYKNAGESRAAKYFILLGFAPWVANFEGVLWKDVGMAFSLLLAIGLLDRKQLSVLNVIIVVSLLLYGFMVRGNAPAALIPIVWYVCGKIFPSSSNWIKFVFTTVSMILMFTFLNFFNYHLLEAERNHMVSYVMVDDLIHLSQIDGKSLLPQVDSITVKECSEEIIGGTKLVGRLFCLITKPRYQEVAPIPYEEIKREWFSALKTYPSEYIKFRLNAYFYLLRNPFEKPYIYWFSGISLNDMGLVKEENISTRILKVYVNGMAHLIPFVFKPYWWLITALLFLGATWKMHGDKDALKVIRVLLVSALLYMFSYIPLTPMADFRYIYWSSLAISLAAIKFATSTLTFRLNWHAI